jgi:hypothetical protein
MKNAGICKALGSWTENISELRRQRAVVERLKIFLKLQLKSNVYHKWHRWAHRIADLRGRQGRCVKYLSILTFFVPGQIPLMLTKEHVRHVLRKWKDLMMKKKSYHQDVERLFKEWQMVTKMRVFIVLIDHAARSKQARICRIPRNAETMHGPHSDEIEGTSSVVSDDALYKITVVSGSSSDNKGTGGSKDCAEYTDNPDYGDAEFQDYADYADYAVSDAAPVQTSVGSSASSSGQTTPDGAKDDAAGFFGRLIFGTRSVSQGIGAHHKHVGDRASCVYVYSCIFTYTYQRLTTSQGIRVQYICARTRRFFLYVRLDLIIVMLQRTMLLLDQRDDRPYAVHSFSEDMTDELQKRRSSLPQARRTTRLLDWCLQKKRQNILNLLVPY